MPVELLNLHIPSTQYPGKAEFNVCVLTLESALDLKLIPWLRFTYICGLRFMVVLILHRNGFIGTQINLNRSLLHRYHLLYIA